MARIVAGGVVVLALVVAALVLWWSSRGPADQTAQPPAPSAQPTTEASSLTGLPPAAVAAQMSRDAFPGGAANVLLVRDSASADALAVSGLQGQLSAPLLLSATGSLPPETAAELERLGSTEIHVLGGPAAISVEVEQQLRDAGYGLHRHAGATSADTAVDVATRHFQASTTAVLVSLGPSGLGPIEAIAESLPASSLAAAQQLPVLLTAPDQLPPVTAEHLAASSISRVLVVGDAAMVSDVVLESVRALGVEAVRVAAGDRFTNAVAVAQTRGFADASAASVVVLAQGVVDSVWPASFIGSINTGRFVGAPMVMADGDTLPAPTRQFLSPADPSSAFLLCVPGVPEATCAQGRELIAGGAP